MTTMSIGEIGRRAGVATSTIRYYERIGLLPPTQRVNTKRRYDAGVLQQLAIIRLAQDVGFTLAEIQTLLHDFPTGTPPSARWQTLAGQKITELDAAIQQMQAMKAFLEHTADCTCGSLEECAALVEGVI